MANFFSKEENVAFEKLLEAYEDSMVMAKNVSMYRTDPTSMVRSGSIIFRPMPYIARSYDGIDQTANFRGYTQLSVPASNSTYKHSVPWSMTEIDLHDALQEDRLGDAARQKISSDVNQSVLNVASLQSTLVVKRTVASSGFDDIAECESIMNEQGIPSNDRIIGLTTRDYNGMASNLQVATRTLDNKKSVDAYEKAYVGNVANFKTFKLDTAYRLTAAAGGAAITVSTLTAAGNYWTPLATRTATTGETSNIDNRYQTITVSSTASVVAGDCFTIGNVEAVHHITKQGTGNLKTFRVIDVLSGTTMVISPPIISNQGLTDSEEEYQNVTVTTQSAVAAIAFLNTVTAGVNPFWYKDSIEILPGSYSIPTNAGANVMRGRTSQGMELVMQKFYDIATMQTRFRIDTTYGVVNKQPEMSGIMLFNQT